MMRLHRTKVIKTVYQLLAIYPSHSCQCVALSAPFNKTEGTNREIVPFFLSTLSGLAHFHHFYRFRTREYLESSHNSIHKLLRTELPSHICVCENHRLVGTLVFFSSRSVMCTKQSETTKHTSVHDSG